MEAKDIEKHKQELLQIGIIVNDFGTEFSLCVDDKKRPLPDICKVTEKIFEISFKAGIKEVVEWMKPRMRGRGDIDEYDTEYWITFTESEFQQLKEWKHLE